MINERIRRMAAIGIQIDCKLVDRRAVAMAAHMVAAAVAAHMVVERVRCTAEPGKVVTCSVAVVNIDWFVATEVVDKLVDMVVEARLQVEVVEAVGCRGCSEAALIEILDCRAVATGMALEERLHQDTAGLAVGPLERTC